MWKFSKSAVAGVLSFALLLDSSFAACLATPGASLNTFSPAFASQAFASRLLHFVHFAGGNEPKVEAEKIESFAYAPAQTTGSDHREEWFLLWEDIFGPVLLAAEALRLGEYPLGNISSSELLENSIRRSLKRFVNLEITRGMPLENRRDLHAATLCNALATFFYHSRGKNSELAFKDALSHAETEGLRVLLNAA